MSWYRVYRLPGDREFWRIDSGDGTGFGVRVKQIFVSGAAVNTVDRPSAHPRAWLAVHARHLFVDGDTAYLVNTVKQYTAFLSCTSGDKKTDEPTKN